MLRIRMDAEIAYLFRHALLRTAAYELQVPGDRARLNELAFHLIEQAFGGRAPEPAPLGLVNAPPFRPHATDAVALDLVRHLTFAQQERPDGPDPTLRELKNHYTRRAAEHAEINYRNEAARELWFTLAQEHTGVARAAALLRFARSALAAKKLDEGLRAVDDAAAVAREAQSRHIEALCLDYKATLLQYCGRAAHAEPTYELALQVYRELKDTYREAVSLGNLGSLYWTTGRVEQAKQLYEQALAIHRKNGDRKGEATVLGNLGMLRSGDGNLEEADLILEQALAIHRESGNRVGEGGLLASLASNYHQEGRLESAESTFQQALATVREVGDWRTLGVILGNLAGLYAATGRAAEAVELFREALELHREVRNRRFEGLHRCDYGASLVLFVPYSDACDTWRAGIAILREIGDTPGEAAKTTAMHEACTKAGIAPFDKP